MVGIWSNFAEEEVPVSKNLLKFLAVRCSDPAQLAQTDACDKDDPGRWDICKKVSKRSARYALENLML